MGKQTYLRIKKTFPFQLTISSRIAVKIQADWVADIRLLNLEITATG